MSLVFLWQNNTSNDTNNNNNLAKIESGAKIRILKNLALINLNLRQKGKKNTLQRVNNVAPSGTVCWKREPDDTVLILGLFATSVQIFSVLVGVPGKIVCFICLTDYSVPVVFSLLLKAKQQTVWQKSNYTTNNVIVPSKSLSFLHTFLPSLSHLFILL